MSLVTNLSILPDTDSDLTLGGDLDYRDAIDVYYESATIDFDGVEYPLVKLEISRTSHPFYTGKSKLVDTAGRIDKFKTKYAKFKKEEE